MTHRTLSMLTCGLAAALLVACLPAAAQVPPITGGEGNANISIEFRMGTLDAGERSVKKSYTLVVASGSMGSTLLVGQRVPFPTAGGNDDDGVIYQNIGFATDAKAWIVGEGKVKLMADIEDSRIREGKDEDLPFVETRQLTINAILTDGVPLELTRAEGLTDQAGFVEVEVRILK